MVHTYFHSSIAQLENQGTTYTSVTNDILQLQKVSATVSLNISAKFIYFIVYTKSQDISDISQEKRPEYLTFDVKK